jgi:hypothetical protein
MKGLLFFFFILILSLSGSSQSCLPEGLMISSQAQIDSFPINYPSCSHIQGDVIIGGENINSLNGLNNIITIDGLLRFQYNPLLTSLSGLQNLTFVGGNIEVDDNAKLTNLNGLNNLTTVGGTLLIHSNDNLINLSGLEGLTSIRGGLRVYYNYKLNDIAELSNLTHIGGVVDISDDSVLYSLTGLEGIHTITGELRIMENPGLKSLAGLSNLSTCEYLYIENNISLPNLSGLNNLVTARDGIQIGENPVLTDLSALSSLIHMGSTLGIYYNDTLTSLSGIDNINPDSIEFLTITNNKSLSFCAVKSICDYFASNKSGNVYANYTGCNSQAEIDTACKRLSVQNLNPTTCYSLYPNPTTGKFTIETNNQTGSCNITILNLSGEKILESQISSPKEEIDISTLPIGIYFVRYYNNRTVEVRKLLKD